VQRWCEEMDEMRITKIVKKLGCVGLALFFVGAALSSNPGHAQQRVKPEVVLPAHYPDGFHGWGRIDRISETEVVIDDGLYKFAAHAEFNTPERSNVSIYTFKPGAKVGFMKSGKKQIISLWLIE
jgi:hypothetical protein